MAKKTHKKKVKQPKRKRKFPLTKGPVLSVPKPPRTEADAWLAKG